MRRIFVALLAALALTLIGGAETAKAAPCFVANGGCMHWPDYNRSTRAVIPDYVHNLGSEWVAVALPDAFAAFDGSQLLLGHGTPQVRSDNVCVQPWAFVQNICGGGHAGTPCGTDGNGNPYYNWLGCVWTYWMYNTLGQPTPHMVYTIARIKTVNPTYTNGTEYTWVARDRRVLSCHELSGHGMGLTHTESDPSNSSCLAALFDNSTGLTLGSTVVGNIFTNHNHNDPTTEYSAWSLRSSKSQGKPISVAEAVPVRGRTPDGKRVFVVPAGTNVAAMLRPENVVYASPAPAQAFGIDKPPWQRFAP